MASLNRDFVLGVATGAGAAAALAAVAYLVAPRSAKVTSAVSTPAAADAAASSTPSAALSTTSSAHDGRVYETDTAVSEYLMFHFGNDDMLLPYASGPRDSLNFAARTARLCVEWCRRAGVPLTAAFDVGCAVGRSTFELSRDFDRVLGLDFSHAFIKAANSIKASGSAECILKLEGEIAHSSRVALPTGVRPAACSFMQGDACDLPRDQGRFSLIHGANLLCRLPDPNKCLERLPSLLVPGGLVVFVSPYSWLPQYTPKDKWLGGYTDAAGVERFSRDGLTAGMTALGFKLLHDEDCPFLMREHARKFQWGCSHVTVWQLAPSS